MGDGSSRGGPTQFVWIIGLFHERATPINCATLLNRLQTCHNWVDAVVSDNGNERIHAAELVLANWN